MTKENAKEYLEKNLKMIGDGPVCETEANAVNKFSDINSSDILTKLIQEAGRICESYASDLFVQWDSVRNAVNSLMKEKKGESFVYTSYIGFRNMGVDHAEFIASRMQEPELYGRPYRKIYRLDITCNEGGYWPAGAYDVKAVLYLVYIGQPTRQ